jgi:hypothetical protein
MSDSFFAIFKCLKKEPKPKETSKQRRTSQISPSNEIVAKCAKCGERLPDDTKKQFYSINGDIKQVRNIKSEPVLKEKQLCERCENGQAFNDNLSQSTYSFGTSYTSASKRRLKSDGDGGEPTDPMEAKYKLMPYKRYIFGPAIKPTKKMSK